ncbi:MAG TPA: helix-turn-helix transcriptional regulator [Clostridia bacterium]
MEMKQVIAEIRKQHGLSQEEMAEKLFVTRQAVSRWENGETTPNIETLKAISKLLMFQLMFCLDSPKNLYVKAAEWI